MKEVIEIEEILVLPLQKLNFVIEQPIFRFAVSRRAGEGREEYCEAGLSTQ